MQELTEPERYGPEPSVMPRIRERIDAINAAG